MSNIKPSKYGSTDAPRRRRRPARHKVTGNSVANRSSKSNNLQKAYKKLKKNKAIKQTNNLKDNKKLAKDCLMGLGITVKIDANPNKSLLREEDTSNKIVNPNIVDLEANEKLQKSKTDASDKFKDMQDPWHNIDEAKLDYETRNDKVKKIQIQPDLSSVVIHIDALYMMPGIPFTNKKKYNI